MQCFLCGSQNFIKKYSLQRGIISSCQTCGIFVKQTTNQLVEKLYDDRYYDSYPYSNTLGLNNRYYDQKIKKIIGHTNSKPHILDVGCGWGDFLERCTARGLPCFGIDHSPTAISHVRKKKINCDVSDIESFAQKHAGEFDAITSFQTIEHVKNPLLFLKSAQTLLKPGGIILLTTPNNDSPLRYFMRGKWSVYNIESHYIFFSKQTLHQAVEKTGFTTIKIHLDSPRFFSSNYILSRLSAQLPAPIDYLLSKLPLPTDPFGDLIVVAFRP